MSAHVQKVLVIHLVFSWKHFMDAAVKLEGIC